MRRRTNAFTISDFYCTKCGKQNCPLPRRPSQQREAGHLKNLWCPYCRQETNHVEIKPFGNYTVEDFKQEFNLGRFVEGERCEVKDLISCSKIDCLYNVDGKCWNYNNSFNCKHKAGLYE